MTTMLYDGEPRKENEEGLFARDIDGQLIRFVAATDDDYDRDVTLTIDGQSITVKQAVPSTDAQGNILNDADGNTIPRRTTIYDASRELFVKKIGDVNPIPTLCHLEHMTPAGVCRICVVEVMKNNRRDSKLLPACHHRVEPGMEIHTLNSPDLKAAERVRTSVRVLTELLTTDHLKPEAIKAAATGSRVLNELEVLAARPLSTTPTAGKPNSVAASALRFAPRTFDRGRDDSSAMIAVDHNACILCDRCVRACDEVKKNHVISRSGKGYVAKINFDLGDPMGKSSCVSCGECMISCPTDALTYRGSPKVPPSLPPDATIAKADELIQNYPIFGSLPRKFLQWNEGSIVRRDLKKGDVLCREGDHGATAFLLIKGKFQVSIRSSQSHVENEKAKGILGFLGQITTRLVRAPKSDSRRRKSIPNDGGSSLSFDEYGIPVGIKTPEDVIIGEMACMNYSPRSATIIAMEPAEVLEIRKNVLYLLQRNPVTRELFNKVYRERALTSHLQELTLLSHFDEAEREACALFLRDKVDLVRVDPGQTIFRQGQRADHFYMVRLGFVKVTQSFIGGDRVLDYLGPGRSFGEIGLLSRMADILSGTRTKTASGSRTATCTALDNVELVRIQGKHFAELVDAFPKLRDKLIKESLDLLRRDASGPDVSSKPLKEFLEDGLFGAQNLLVLDLESCTRCDECTKACADTHGGVTRLIRDGLRFDRFLVASSCRSCMDPYCLVGCPVDAIHREMTKEIQIDDHCIGCGLCAQNCPYGNINMHKIDGMSDDPLHPGRRIAAKVSKATTCDMCRDVVGPGEDPSCVYACPHNAAFRMTGIKLLDIVSGESLL